MQLHVIETGHFRLDGGAMFGVVPKPVWQKTNPADERNRIRVAARCLLIDTGDRRILVDTGLGDKYDERFADLYGIEPTASLRGSLAAVGASPDDITDLLLTHLHFDHCGGTTRWDAEHRPVVAFPNARIHVARRHLDWALHPNPREAASFFAENIAPMQASDQLQLWDLAPGTSTDFLPGIRLRVFEGHTEAMVCPEIQYRGHTLLYGADLFPTHGHIPLPYVMGYDVRPLATMAEREPVLRWLVESGAVLFFEHDPDHHCGTVRRDDRGKYLSDQRFPLSDLG